MHFKTADIEGVFPDCPPPGALVNADDGLWYGPYYGFQYAKVHTGHAYPAGHWRMWLERDHPAGLELWRPENALAPRSGAYASLYNAIPADWHYTNWTVDRTIEWLRDHQNGQSFFLWMSFADPHQPFAPPRPCNMYDDEKFPSPVPPENVSRKPAHYQRSRKGLSYGGYNTLAGWSGDHFREIVSHYYGLTTFIDDSIARVMAELNRLGLAENTHVVFTSNHGEGLADHGIAGKPMMSYECVNRVPMLWCHPPTVKSGSVYQGIMSHLDLTPTFLDLAGAEPLSGMEGRSFAPVLRGEIETRRDAVIVERISVLRSPNRDVTPNAQPKPFRSEHANEDIFWVKMLVTEGWKLLHYGSAPYGELYDVVNDPDDLNNLWDDFACATVQREFSERLLAELIDSELGDPATILDHRAVSGALRDARLMEPQPEARSNLDKRIWGMC